MPPRLHPLRIEVLTADGDAASAPLGSSGEHTVGPLVVTISDAAVPGTGGWSVANATERPVRIRSVSLVFALGAPRSDGPIRMLRHGYQSWSPTDVAILGLDRDPSESSGSVELIRAAAHADARQVAPGELRSEWVTLIGTGKRAGDGDDVLVGFDGGSRHDGTIRLRQGTGGEATPEVVTEAFLGGVRLGPGESRRLHRLVVDDTPDRRASERLHRWARIVGQNEAARTHQPFQVGWCSWYHYFHDVTEEDLEANRRRVEQDGWPFDVVQLDDGFQAAIGDWLETNDKFPSDLGTLAGRIREGGKTAGIWIAPFLAAPDSQVATEHPDWLARMPDGERFLPGSHNPPWGGGLGGLMWALDVTNPAVLAHLERVAHDLKAAGFDYLKLDFTYAASFEGVWHDDSFTPAMRVRAGFEAIRRGAGEDAFILGCGVPLANVVGIVDGNRIGADVAPSWAGERTAETDPFMAGYLGMLPATRNAALSTISRSFMHRTLWLNDPDCLMLRHAETAMSAAQIAAWADVIAESGGMVLVSDDLSLLGPDDRRRLDDVVAIGRERDADAAEGRPPVAADPLATGSDAHTLVARSGERLVLDAATGAARRYGANRAEDEE